MLLAGCVHRIDIQQGNFLDTEDIDRIAVGMTRVPGALVARHADGADPFQSSRWDYVYYLKRGRWQKPQQRHFIVFFDSTDKVAKIDAADGAARKDR